MSSPRHHGSTIHDTCRSWWGKKTEENIGEKRSSSSFQVWHRHRERAAPTAFAKVLLRAGGSRLQSRRARSDLTWARRGGVVGCYSRHAVVVAGESLKMRERDGDDGDRNSGDGNSGESTCGHLLLVITIFFPLQSRTRAKNAVGSHASLKATGIDKKCNFRFVSEQRTRNNENENAASKPRARGGAESFFSFGSLVTHQSVRVGWDCVGWMPTVSRV